MEELKKIDQLRHDATHKPNFANPIPNVTGKLRFLHCTLLLLEKLAEKKYPGRLGGSEQSARWGKTSRREFRAIAENSTTRLRTDSDGSDYER